MSVTHKVTNLYYSIIGSKPSDYLRYLLVITIGAAAIGGGYYGYKTYISNREQAAQKVLADCLQEYAQAQAGGEPWANIEQLCKLGYEQHAHSYSAPYFLMMQADALVNQQKNAEALAILDKVITTMDKDSSLFPLYATKRALVYLDRGNEQQQQEGLTQLTALAHDSANIERDMALYYLGLYYWSHDNNDQAQSLWQELINSTEKEELKSPWVSLAQAKLH